MVYLLAGFLTGKHSNGNAITLIYVGGATDVLSGMRNHASSYHQYTDQRGRLHLPYHIHLILFIPNRVFIFIVVI